MSEIHKYFDITHFVAAPCSTGKTYAACQYISENQHDTNHIYICPSLDLLKQTAATLRGVGVTPTVITSRPTQVT